MTPEQRERARKHLTSDIRFAERSAQWYQDLPSHEGDRTSAMMAERYAVTADALRAVLAMLEAEPVGYAVATIARMDDGYAYVVGMETMTYETASEAKSASEVSDLEDAEVVALLPVRKGGE